jgi:hypothetical protein
VVASLKMLCTDTVATVELQLETQKQSDAAEARRLWEEENTRAEEEMRKRKDEEMRQELAQAAATREWLEETRKLAEMEMAIMKTERDLRAQKQALIDANKSAGINIDDVDDDDDDEHSDSAPEEQPVRFLFISVLPSILITLLLSIRKPERRRQGVSRKRLAKGCPK